MKRTIEQELWQWKKRPQRCPLIVRGARQVGKSYIIEKFGQAAFDQCIVVNFELNPEMKDCFTSLDPSDIIEKLKIYKNVDIKPQHTLVFLDEIQRAPQALMSLRYFKEKLPDLHVIAAGSLLEFTLQDDHFSFPVGRVEFLYLRPMSFMESLDAMKHDQLVQAIQTWSLRSPPDNGMHKHCLGLLRPYLFVGGMPAIVDLYRRQKDVQLCARYQAALMKTYRDDFGKYANTTQHKYLQRVLERAPFLIGKHFKYSKIDATLHSRDLKTAAAQLSQADLIHFVYATKANGIPLQSEMNEKKFKILLIDVGLLQLALGNLASEISQHDIIEIHRGALAEQFVGQELLAYSDSYIDKQLHFWEREKKESSAEVDYVVNIDGRVVPIEVKAGATGRLRSLHQFMHEKKVDFGVRISEKPLQFENHILSVPLYMIQELPRLLQAM